MKKIYSILPFLFVCLFYSCIAPYQMTTTINEKGEVTKDIYTASHLEEKTGRVDLEAFPFISADGWNVFMTDTSYVYYAGKPQPMNARATRSYPSLEAAGQTAVKQSMLEFFSPREQFRKQFRWFYTYYTYEACFPETVEKGKIPIENYLTPQEIDIWVTGKNKEDYFRGMNGMEINLMLQEIEKKFMTWLKHNLFEVAFETLESHIVLNGPGELISLIEQVNKEEFFTTWFVKKEYSLEEEREVSVKTIAQILDEQFSIGQFLPIYESDKDKLNKKVDDWWDRMGPEQGIVLKYEVKLPGHLVHANTGFIEEGIPSWRITLTSFLMEDYMLTARSRTANPWAFVATFAFIAGIIGIIIWRKKK